MRRVYLVAASTVVAAVVVVVALFAIIDSSRDGAGAAASCPEKLAADQARVRTDRQWTEADIPGVGNYPEIHWQLRAAGNPCSRGPGPTDWQYQGVIRLRPEDAATLAGRFDWQPVPAASGEHQQATPDQIWPALVPFVPGGTRWTHSRTWTEAYSQGQKWTDLYLAPDRALALVMLSDH